MLIRFCLSFFILFCSFSAAQAEQCAAVFSDGVQNNHNDGSITFNWDARVVNSPDNILDSNRAIVDGSGGVSCNTGVCSSSGNITAAINYTNFPANANNVSVGFGQTLTISPGSYNNITLDSSATLYVTPGDYILSGVLSVGNLSHIHITGSGVVRIFTSNTVNIDSSAGVNVGGQATNLLIYARERFDILSSAEVTAFIYSNKDVTVQSSAVVNGAISGKSVTLFSPSTVNFVNTEPEFGDFCNKTPVLPLANYRFDECEYTGSGFEVIDQTGNFSAITHGGVDTFDAGQVERGADVFDEDHHFETSIALPNNFSVSTWFKKPTSTHDSRYFVLGSMHSGGDLLYLDRDNSWRWGVYNVNTGNANGTYSFAALDDNWHHMALVYSGGQTQLYIDGILTDTVNKAPSGTLEYIGTSFDDVSGSNPQGFRAPLDEFIVFDGALSSSEITDIYNNQNAGNNYDGSSRQPVTCSSIIANYRFDECEYTGVGFEAIDQTGNFSAITHGGVDTFDAGQVERGADVFDEDHHFETNIVLPSDFSVSTWFKKPTSNSDSRLFVLGSMQAGGDLLYINRDSNWRWGGWNPNTGAELGSFSFATLDNNWHHMALVFSGGQTQLYIDGVFTDAVNRVPVGTLKYIGTSFDDVNTSDPQGFRAPLDEFIVFDGVLSSSEITDIYNNQNAENNYDGSARAPVVCSILDHFEINHDGNGLTCQPETITIKACADAACSALYNDAIDVGLLINGTFDQTVTISGGSMDTSFSYTNVGNATLSLDQTYECKNGGSTSCDVVFADAGFRFLYGAAESTIIGSQISGNSFVDTVQLQAVENVNGVCTGLFTGNKDVDLSQQNIAPGSTTGLKFKINGANGTTIDKFPTYTSGITLNFGADSKATIPTPVYLDAGQIRLYAKYDVGGVNLVGNSNDFWVSPAQIEITASNGSELNNTGFLAGENTHAAGVDFTLSLKAVNSLGTTTTNYFSANPELKLIRTGPINGGSEGLLRYSSAGNGIAATALATTSPSFSTANGVSFSSGTYSYGSSQYWDVGLINLTVQDVNYGDGTITIPGVAYDIGRFIPEHLEQTVQSSGSLTGTCNLGTWVYSGQRDEGTQLVGAITYDTNPIYRITAYNAFGVSTKNYTTTGNEGFMRLLETGVDITAPVEDAVRVGGDTINKVALTATLSTGNLTQDSNGVQDYTFSSNDHFYYLHNANAEIEPFSAQIPLVVNAIVDQDGVMATSTQTAQPTGVEVRFGRMVLANSFGPETADLPQFLSTQYLAASGKYITNIDDDCSGFNSTKFSLTNIPPLTHNGLASTVFGVLSEGENSSVALQATGAGNQGQIGVEYNIYSWLKYDWDWNGVAAKDFSDNPSAIATFGLFRGNDRIIYQREVNN